MKYYYFHCGDYWGATQKLNALEHGVYRCFIDYCYMHEQPLPLDMVELVKISGRNEALNVTLLKYVKQAIQAVLEQFFEAQEDGWHHPRIERDVIAYGDRTPHRQARKLNLHERQARYRNERKRLFDELRGKGAVMPFNSSMRDLRTVAQKLGILVETPIKTSQKLHKTSTENGYSVSNHSQHEWNGMTHHDSKTTRSNPSQDVVIATTDHKPLTNYATRHEFPDNSQQRADGEPSVAEHQREVFELFQAHEIPNIRLDDEMVRRLIERGATRRDFQVYASQAQATGKPLSWLLYRVGYRLDMRDRDPDHPPPEPWDVNSKPRPLSAGGTE